MKKKTSRIKKKENLNEILQDFSRMKNDTTDEIQLFTAPQKSDKLTGYQLKTVCCVLLTFLFCFQIKLDATKKCINILLF